MRSKQVINQGPSRYASDDRKHEDTPETRQASRKKFKIFALIYFSALAVILGFITVMDRIGYKLLDGSLTYKLLGMLICSVLIGLVILLVRICKARWLKIAVGVVGGCLTLLVTVVLITIFSMYIFYAMPTHFTTLTAPGGEKIAIMYALSDDEESMELRYNLRKEAEALAEIENADAEETQKEDGEESEKTADAEEAPAAEAPADTEKENAGAQTPETEESVQINDDELQTSDFGCVYLAFPQYLKFFYDSRFECDGHIEMGYESKALLKYEFLEGNTLKMYLEEPEPGDYGEFTLVYKH